MEIVVPNFNDFTSVNVIAKEVHELHVAWRPDLFVSVDPVILEDKFKELLDKKEIVVAKKEGQIVGYATFEIKEKANHGMRQRKQFNIDVIAVYSKNKRQGVGTAILEYLKDMAKREKCTDMYLNVNEENMPAIKIYEKFGFKLKNISYTMEI